MKKRLREQFLPFNYTQTMFQRLHTRWQAGRSFDDYTEEFYQLVARNNLSETEEQQVARYILYSLWTISKPYQRALTIEKQQSKSRASVATIGDSGLRTGQFQDRGARHEDAPSGGHRGVIAAPINHPTTTGLVARVQGNNLTLCCLKCREAGHKAGDCRKLNSHLDKSKKLMIVNKNLEDTDGYDGDSIYIEEPNVDDLVYGDVGESLVIRKSLLKPK
ncbi:hypothetical protein AMTRI_Chr01g133100 [Amborella trichopoda]